MSRMPFAFLATCSTLAAGAVLAAGAAAAPLFVTPPTLRPSLQPLAQESPLTNAQCQQLYKVPCYSVSQLRTAYGMPTLYKAGDTGKGQTIVIVDSFGSPTIRQDLATFDSAKTGYGLTAPPSFDIIAPVGPIPKYDPTNRDMVVWAGETTLDVQWAHAMAPDANILLVETPVAETVGETGFPEIVEAENYVIQHKLGNVISQSFGTAEQTFSSSRQIVALRSAFKAAQAAGVTLLAGSGDNGVSDPIDAEGTMHFTSRVVSWPASDPLVTAVGGTQLHLDASGARTAPDNVWNDADVGLGPIASGGGVSSVFAVPSYQSGSPAVSKVVGKSRGTPDVSMNAAYNGAIQIYTSYGGRPTGWAPIGGTSEATPLFAALVAIADQVAGHGLGPINRTLYRYGSGRTALTDITAGNNTVSFTQGGKQVTVTGYAAKQGYDLASGLGTPNAPALVSVLAKG
jgi:subtilase family serine protease